MEILITDANNLDFINLTKELDQSLHTIGFDQSEQDKSKYASFNELSTITKAFVLYDNKTPIGCAAFKEYDQATAEVKRVFVNENYRGKGLAKLLLIELEKQAKQNDFSRLILETSQNNTLAIKFYSSIGYSKIDNFPPYIHMSDSFCMGKDLN